MFHILSSIKHLTQHIQHLNERPNDYKPKGCVHCGWLVLHKHGCFVRQADRERSSADTLNPVKIPRFRCARCRRTCSTLPEFLSPRRWYDWNLQAEALKLCIAGWSYKAIAKKLRPSRTTIARWMRRLEERFKHHSDYLRQKISSLCMFSEWKSFWKNCLEEIPLSQAMRHLHNARIIIP
jgi:transposase-like protein